MWTRSEKGAGSQDFEAAGAKKYVASFANLWRIQVQRSFCSEQQGILSVLHPSQSLKKLNHFWQANGGKDCEGSAKEESPVACGLRGWDGRMRIVLPFSVLDRRLSEIHESLSKIQKHLMMILHVPLPLSSAVLGIAILTITEESATISSAPKIVLWQTGQAGQGANPIAWAHRQGAISPSTKTRIVQSLKTCCHFVSNPKTRKISQEPHRDSREQLWRMSFSVTSKMADDVFVFFFQLSFISDTGTFVQHGMPCVVCLLSIFGSRLCQISSCGSYFFSVLYPYNVCEGI